MRAKRRVMGLIRWLADGVLPLLFWVFMIFGFDEAHIAILTILTALLHELGHIVAIIALRLDRGGRLSAHISGFRIKKEEAGYLADIIVLSAGPLANILLFTLSLPFGDALEGYISLLGEISLFTGLSNLMPLEGYDGYGILSRLLLISGKIGGIIYLEYLSFSVSVLFTLISLYLLFFFGEGYWIFGIFFALMLGRIKAFIKTDVLRE